jgi:hypothetical protein
MGKVRSRVGLDVHARSVLAVTIDGESGEMRTRNLSGNTSEVVEFCCGRAAAAARWWIQRATPSPGPGTSTGPAIVPSAQWSSDR